MRRILGAPLFVPAVHRVLVVTGIVILAAAIIALGVTTVTAVHDARAAREQLCAAKLEALEARNAFIQRFARHADACLALQIATRTLPEETR